MGQGNIYLVGFMCSGKSSVGRLVAGVLRLQWVDLDEVITEATGLTPRDAFDRYGEAWFRDRETEALSRVAAQTGLVVSTGGGIVLKSENRELMRSSGIVVHLDIDAEDVIARIGDVRTRPLLDTQDPTATAEKLICARNPIYANARHIVVHTHAKMPSDVTREVVAAIEAYCESKTTQEEPLMTHDGTKDIFPQGGVIPSAHEVVLHHRFGTCPITVKAGLLADVGHMMADNGLDTGAKVMVVTNPTVFDIYGSRLMRSLASAGISAEVFQMPDGEEFKSLPVATAAWTKALDLKLDRRSALLALGGGVVCDMAGFIASTYMRGIDFYQVPTTLLAQVDASVGGKVAVNLPQGKNVVGAFHQPSAVFIDTVTLATLDTREMASGLAEMIKHGTALDASLFVALEDLSLASLKDPETLSRLIAWNVRLKKAVVEEDETETGKRALLNLGHTVGHALESLTHYTRYKHGEAVSVGMVCAVRISASMGLIDLDVYNRVKALCSKFGLPTSIESIPELSAESIIDEMVKDKKTISGTPKFVLIEAIGKARYGVEVDSNVLTSALVAEGASR